MSMVSEIIEAVNSMIEKKIKDGDYAKIRTGRINTVNSDGTYDVVVDSQILEDVINIGSGTLSVNNIVRIIYPDNQATQAVILGLSGGSTPTGNYEETTNKVTSISSSSTNVQYPSAKAVYDYAEDKSNKVSSVSSYSSYTTKYPTTKAVYDYAEDKSNKVTSISSSSTNTSYPSALAVYNYVYNQIYSALNSSY